MPEEKLRLMCLVLPDNKPRNHIFEVKLDINETVASLKKLIKLERAHRLADVDAADLILWACSIPNVLNLKETLNTIRFDGTDTSVRRLESGTFKITKYFPTTLPRKTIHILIELPVLENDASPPALPDLLQQRQQYNTVFSEMAPSSLRVPAEFSKIQEDDRQKIVGSRPPTADTTIPVVLFHHTMREFIDDCANHHPIGEDNLLVLKLTHAMSHFFPNDEDRATELRDILQDNGIPATTLTLSFKDYFFQVDGVIDSSNHLISIFEVNGEIGSEGAEPYAQAIVYYAHSGWKKSEEHPTFNFPCLIITVFGAHVSFSGVIWGARPHFQVLTPSIPLFCHQTDTDMRESLARQFGAFKKAIQSLERCYEALKNPVLLNDLNPQFPDPRTYHCLETKAIVRFKYLFQTDEKRLLFLGKTDDDKDIMIKFVRRYSQAAHEKCASMGIAPKLRGFEDIGAGWTMVIMDDLGEEYKTLDANALPTGTRETIRSRISELHQAHFVHGDVRNVNIMVRKDGKPDFMLVDFDWAGMIGEVRYPANVNKMNFWRPADVSDGMPIKPEHDLAMLEHMFR